MANRRGRRPRSNSLQLNLMSVRPLCRLKTLPVEIVIEIFKNLDWKDLIDVRLTSHAMAEITRTRSIWQRLVSFYVYPLSHSTRIHHLERPLVSYTSSELEALFLKWKGAELGWRTKAGRPVRERRLETKKCLSCCLLPGGRWFLVITTTGSVVSYDLIMEDPSGKVLMADPRGFEGEIINGYFSAPDIDSASSVLTLNIAIMLRTRTQAVVRIWRISPLSDGKGQNIGLLPECLARFELDPAVMWENEASLLGPYVAFIGTKGLIQSTVIIDWEQANGKGLNYSRRMLRRARANIIRLLPNNQIFIVYDHSVRLFNYLDIQETTCALSFDKSDLKTELWTIDHDKRFNGSCSQPIFRDNSIELVMYQCNPFSYAEPGILSGFISRLRLHGDEKSFSTMQLPTRSVEGHITPSFGHSLGQENLVIIDNFGYFLIPYSCLKESEEPDQDEISEIFSEYYQHKPNHRNVIMDEGSGRIVHWNPDWDYRIVIDLNLNTRY